MKDILPLIEVPLPILLLTPIFLAFFIGMVVWVYRSSASKQYKQIGDIPLSDGTEKQ